MNQDESERLRTERIQQAEQEVDGAPTDDDAIPAPDEGVREENS